MKHTIEELKEDVEVTYGCLGNEDDHLPDILEILEKQLPKKLNVEVVKDKGIFSGTFYHCPNCGIQVFNRDWNKYCHECGTPFDWGD